MPLLMPPLGSPALMQQAGALTSFMPPAQPVPYGLREDGTPKGNGFFGMLPHSNGNRSSELSIGVNFDGKEHLIPSLVPTLSREEINHLLGGNAMTDAIVSKAVEHARQRMMAGLPVWAMPNEPALPLPPE